MPVLADDEVPPAEVWPRPIGEGIPKSGARLGYHI